MGYKQEEKPADEVKPADDKTVTSNDDIINIANRLWLDLKKKVKENPDFGKIPDSEKLDLFHKNEEFKKFYTELPIVSRYMICMGQYSVKALKRYLKKCKNVKLDQSTSRESGYIEDQWIQRQADYVRYLWESYQKQHFSKKDSNAIWAHAYETLKKEFSDFRILHKEIEAKLQTNEKNNKNSLTKELLTRLSTNEQFLDDNSTKDLIVSLQDKLIKQRRREVMSDITKNVMLV